MGEDLVEQNYRHRFVYTYTYLTRKDRSVYRAMLHARTLIHAGFSSTIFTLVRLIGNYLML